MKLFQFKKTLAFILSLCMLISMFAVVSVSAVNNFSLKANSTLSISVNGTDKIICGISESTTVAELLANFENSESITVCKNDVVLAEDKKVGTGTSVVFDDDIAYVVIEGDTDGNGRIDSTDYLQIKKFFLETYLLEGVFFEAADTDNDNSVSSADYLQVKMHFLGSFNLNFQPDKEESNEFVSYADVEKRDLNGRDVYITERWFGYGDLTIDFTGEVLYMEDDDGLLNNVNQAKKDIIETVQKDYNCKISGEIFGEGSTSIVNDLKNLITTDIIAGTGKYDFFFESFYYYTNLIAGGMLTNIKDLSTINLKSSCWDQNAVSELSICDALYFILGDINTYDNDGTIAMLFNKELYEELGYTEDLYQIVKDREWTFDKLVELSNSFDSIDHNLDDLRNEYDYWFMGSETYNLYSHVIAAGESICQKDDNDEPQLTMTTDRTIQALTDAVKFYISGQVLIANLPEYQEKYPRPGEAYERTVTNAFLEGRELFYMTSLIHIPYFRQMEDEFGILPVPMYSDSQDDYYSHMSARVSSVLMIPNTFKADEDLGLVIQALAELSEEKLTREYYKKQLKFRIFTDEESAEMLDIIFENRHYDLGTVFGLSWNDVDDLYSVLDTDIKNRFEENEEVIKDCMKETMDGIKNYLNSAK